ncbi:hypothetical protein [Mesorhizobium sp.]|uniref:hypothetical protein n=1 Tax=Mesorhizobium sp. TaxID=1871066 RepID=UPI00257C1F49|nr:hypothetical protein [Mesorhizobium sp.]
MTTKTVHLFNARSGTFAAGAPGAAGSHDAFGAILLEDEVDVAPFGETPKIGHLVRIGPNAPALDHLDIAIGDAVAEKQER